MTNLLPIPRRHNPDAGRVVTLEVELTVRVIDEDGLLVAAATAAVPGGQVYDEQEPFDEQLEIPVDILTQQTSDMLRHVAQRAVRGI